MVEIVLAFIAVFLIWSMSVVALAIKEYFAIKSLYKSIEDRHNKYKDVVENICANCYYGGSSICELYDLIVSNFGVCDNFRVSSEAVNLAIRKRNMEKANYRKVD